MMTLHGSLARARVQPGLLLQLQDVYSYAGLQLYAYVVNMPPAGHRHLAVGYRHACEISKAPCMHDHPCHGQEDICAAPAFSKLREQLAQQPLPRRRYVGFRHGA